MEEKESQSGKKMNTGLILFIPLAIIIVVIFILMRWENQLVYEDEPITEESIPAPNFTLPGLDGESVSLDDYRGKVVLLNIWATWCPPCVAEAPSLEKLNKRFKDDDFKLLTVSIDEGGESVIVPFMERNKLSFPVLVDPEGSIMELYRTTGVPESFIIRKDGIVDGKIEGALDWTSPEVVEYINNLIRE
ncbi:TlpA disulfide reductase family protein [Thermodesulfobacteriota bacterium]